MKKYYSIIFLLFTAFSFAQIPSNYYDSANGLSGYALKTELRNITANGHSPNSYDDLFDLATGYRASDIDDFYENDGTVMDMYSENPTGVDPYNYSYYANPSDKCGNYNSENDCYNGEHLMPQSVYGSNMPMVGDIHQVIPTDGYVNNGRGSLPFGEVTNPADDTYLNGSKRGNCAVVGYSGDVFEPIDEFKGDIARAMLYFAVRYENEVSSWNHDMLNGTNDQVYETWFIDMLLDWHNNDAVNQREINRNNAAYIHQSNANPFVDHPEYADMIWNPTPDNTDPTNPSNLVASNPSDNSVDLTWTASTDNVGVTSYDIYLDNINTYNSTSTTFTANGLTANTNYCFKVKAKDAAGNESGFSNEDCEMTTNNGSSGGDCASEDFEGIPADSSSYSDRSWDGSGGQWNATRGRTDQTINNRAILIDCRTSSNGTLISPTISGGIENLTVTTQRIFTGSDGTLNVLVNGSVVGTIPYSATAQTTTISNINVTGNITVVIEDNDSGSARIGIDDLSWTCHTNLGIKEDKISNTKFYPNPLNGNKLYIETNQSLKIEIFNILGKRIISDEVNSNKNYLNVSDLNSGMYLIKISNDNQTITKKLIKQ